MTSPRASLSMESLQKSELARFDESQSNENRTGCQRSIACPFLPFFPAYSSACKSVVLQQWTSPEGRRCRHQKSNRVHSACDQCVRRASSSSEMIRSSRTRSRLYEDEFSRLTRNVPSSRTSMTVTGSHVRCRSMRSFAPATKAVS